MSFDLWIRNGHVVDPSQNWDGPAEIGIRGGRIAAFGDRLDGEGSAQVYDAAGCYVSPGLIDLHGHWYEGSLFGINAELGLNSGVTTPVDAGTTGFANFPEFRRTVIDRCEANLLAFVHLACFGLPTAAVGELFDLRFARPIETAEMVQGNRDRAVGVKVRIGDILGENGYKAFDMALAAAVEAQAPLMVHVGRGADEAYILERLRPGDILTHCFHGRDNRMVDSRGWIPQVHEARARGVVFDIGHGCGSFSWDTAQRGFEHHFYPDTLSTDLHRYNVGEPFWLTLPDVMARFLCLGMSLGDAIAKTTVTPARVLGRETELGTLRPGAAGDVFVFRTIDGEFPMIDTHLRTRVGKQRIEPVITVRAGTVYPAGSVQRPVRPLYEWDRAVFDMVGYPFDKVRTPGRE